MSEIDGTTPISTMPEHLAEEFAKDRFVDVPLNKAQILREISDMEYIVQDLPADRVEFTEARKNIRDNIAAMEAGLAELVKREKEAHDRKVAAEKKAAARKKKKTPEKKAPVVKKKKAPAKKPGTKRSTGKAPEQEPQDQETLASAQT